MLYRRIKPSGKCSEMCLEILDITKFEPHIVAPIIVKVFNSSFRFRFVCCSIERKT
jgi:hypothetical protein